MVGIDKVITPAPVILDPEARIEEAWRIMHQQRVRHIPVCKGENLVGLITQKDLLVNANNQSVLTLPIAEIMVYDVHTIGIDTDVREAAQIMLKEKISCLPVVEGKQLKGIVTESDFLDLLIGLLDD